MTRNFSDLYSTGRLDTLDALDALPDLKSQIVAAALSATTSISQGGGGNALHRVDSDELKNKLLFSVVVVSLSALYLKAVCK